MFLDQDLRDGIGVGERERCVRVEPSPLPVAGATAFEFVERIFATAAEQVD